MKSADYRTHRKCHSAALILSLLVLLSLSGCGGSSATKVPKADLMNALKTSLPAGLELRDVSYEVTPPANGQTGATIPVKVKITAAATLDLFSKPTDPAEIKAVNDYINSYNDFVKWTNALQFTTYAAEVNRDKPKIDSAVPAFLHRDQLKGDTFTGYCDIVAEHQVDRWIFGPVQGIDWGGKKPGAPSAKFGANCVGANAPDGQAAVQQFQKNEDTMTQFKKQFVNKHAAESGPVVQALKPILTGGQEIQTYARQPGQDVPNFRFTFSAFDPQTNHFGVKYRGIPGETIGTGEIDGAFILIFYGATSYAPGGVGFVGSYDPKTGDVILNRKNADPEVLHTRHS